MTGSPDIVTRFAPSPTGYLHIGGARTALFNWLFARGRGGKFLLRIEDTDRARHSEEAVAAIQEGLAWLGIDWDGPPVSQYAGAERHRAVAQDLLDDGKAYKCYLTPEELEGLREAARAAGTRLESPWRDRDPADGPADAPYAVRFKAPRDGETVVKDAVQGDVAFQNSALDDLIILRSDGAPTYNLAVVVDDHDMGVTHIIRGDDHLNNAARQSQIYTALGWQAPVFAHIPLIHGSDGAKLSKRHGALGAEAYRDMGYLPEAMANYLLRLGWSHGDDEIIPRDKALEWFDLSGVNKAPARLDLDKLAHLNAHYLRATPAETLIPLAEPFLRKTYGAAYTPEKRARIETASDFLKERSKTLEDFSTAAGFLVIDRPLKIEGKAEKPLRKDGAREQLTKLLAMLENLNDWGAESLERALQNYVESAGLSFGQIGPPARAALTAGAPSPSLGEIMAALGRTESLARLRDQAAL
ncbi:MAG: glutamate--tRNA ligase [Pseudomonadota bacterium]